MYTKAEISQACKKFGPQVCPLPSSYDGAQLLWAISGNESSFGANVTPRHEPAFDMGGLYDRGEQHELLEQFGSSAACSYGPWQILFANCPQGSTPDSLADLDTAAQATVGFLNSQLRRFSPKSLVDIACVWNHGSPMSILTPGVQSYANELIHNYVVPMEGA